MGVFGSSSKTYYNSTSSILYEKMPSLIKQTVASSIVQNRNIGSDLITNLVNGVLFNANRLHNYGKSGNYPWGLPQGTTTYIAPQSYTYVQYVIEEQEGRKIELISAYVDTEITSGHLIYKAEYYYLDANGATTGDLQFWEYDEFTELHPILNIEKDTDAGVSPYYPIIPLYENQQYLAESGQPNKQQIEQACRYLSIKPKDIKDAIESNEDYPDNPVDDAYVIIGLELREKSQVGLEYLYTYFNHLLGTSKVRKEDWEYWNENSTSVAPPFNRIAIEDANYKMELAWLYMEDTIVEGVLTKPDTTPAKRGYYESDFQSNGDYASPGGNIFVSTDVFIIRKQINATQYREIVISGLVHSNWAVGKELRTTVSDAFSINNDDVPEAFIIPLRKDLMRVIGNVKSHDLMYMSIRLVLNDKLKVKIKWYATSFFQFLITVIAIVVSIYYPPAGVAITSAAAAAIAIINVVLMKIVLPFLYKKLEDLVGEELAIVIAVIAIAYGGNPADYFNAANFAISKYQAITIGDAMDKINKELTVLADEIEIIEEEIAERQADVLFASNLMKGDPYAILESTNYIRRFKLEYKESTLIRATTDRFTDMSRFVDRPDSYIRLGHTGY